MNSGLACHSGGLASYMHQTRQPPAQPEPLQGHPLPSQISAISAHSCLATARSRGESARAVRVAPRRHKVAQLTPLHLLRFAARLVRSFATRLARIWASVRRVEPRPH
eukprot:5213521-Prymnesium_polylepis.1